MTEPVTEERTTEEAAATPLWLWPVFGMQAFGWVLHALFGVFLVVYISNVPGRVFATAYALLHIAVSGLAALVFVLGAVLPVHPRVLGRVAFVHACVAFLVALPLVAVSIAAAFENAGSFVDVVRPLGIALALIGVAVGCLAASRRSETPVLVGTAMLAVPAVFAGAFVLLGVGISVAGVSA